MKKSLIILVCLLGLFFFLPFINFSMAIPPDYIGVQVGEEYTWTFRVNVNTFTEYATDMGQTVPAEISMFETMSSVQLKGIVASISDEIPGISYDYVIINLSLYMNVPGYGWMDFQDFGEYLPVFVLSNETSNYFNSTMNAMETEMLPPPIGFALPFLIVPHNLNWTDAVQGLNDVVQDFTGGVTGLALEEFGNGFKITIPTQVINGSTMQQMDFIAQWNDKGVFGQGQMLYGGATMMSINVPESEIPGYEITILLGVLGVSTLGLFYYIKKRK